MADDEGGHLDEGAGAVDVGIDSTALTLVAAASGTAPGPDRPATDRGDPRGHDDFGRLVRLLTGLMAADKNYLDRLYDYPQAVTLIKSLAAGAASAGAEPESGSAARLPPARPSFPRVDYRANNGRVAVGVGGESSRWRWAGTDDESGPIRARRKDDFYCVWFKRRVRRD